MKFGANVKIVDVDTEKESLYQIVGEYESDIAQRKISVSSPIARAMIGKSVGNTVEVHAPTGIKEYEILSIKYEEHS